MNMNIPAKKLRYDLYLIISSKFPSLFSTVDLRGCCAKILVAINLLRTLKGHATHSFFHLSTPTFSVLQGLYLCILGCSAQYSGWKLGRNSNRFRVAKKMVGVGPPRNLQEDATEWTPKTWVSKSSSTLPRGPLVRSQFILMDWMIPDGYFLFGGVFFRKLRWNLNRFSSLKGTSSSSEATFLGVRIVFIFKDIYWLVLGQFFCWTPLARVIKKSQLPSR